MEALEMIGISFAVTCKKPVKRLEIDAGFGSTEGRQVERAEQR
jgi:hypothetical protein